MSLSNQDLFLPETQTWVNESTGEKITGAMNIRRVSRENFDIVYATALFDLHEEFGSKKLKVFDTILKHRNNDNVTILTQEKIAELAGVSKQTVTSTIQILERKNAIRKKNGVIFINPQLINRASAEKEKWLILKFEEFNISHSITRGRKKKRLKTNEEVKN